MANEYKSIERDIQVESCICRDERIYDFPRPRPQNENLGKQKLPREVLEMREMKEHLRGFVGL